MSVETSTPPQAANLASIFQKAYARAVALQRMTITKVEVRAFVIHGKIDRGPLDDIVVVHVAAVRRGRA